MQTLATVTTVFAFVAIAIHVYIWIIESFLWTKPRGRETFGMTEEFAESTKEMAANQGLYNLMLAWIAATGLLAFWFGSPQVGVALLFAGLGSMAVAAVNEAGQESKVTSMAIKYSLFLLVLLCIWTYMLTLIVH